MSARATQLIEEAWLLSFRLAWAAAVAPGRRYERLMQSHCRALRRWMRRKQQFSRSETSQPPMQSRLGQHTVPQRRQVGRHARRRMQT